MPKNIKEKIVLKSGPKMDRIVKSSNYLSKKKIIYSSHKKTLNIKAI